MAFRPNFLGARIEDTNVRVSGTSDEEDTDDILDIRVTLVQGERIATESRVATESVARVSSVWNAFIPVVDPEGKGADFRPGPVAAFGVEWRRTNATQITWAQSLTIVQPPGP
jgi:hypothetical protein